jgi:hypothetical protein
VTTACANISENEERGGSIIPAFPKIGTSSFLTNGMEAVGLNELTKFLVMRARL